MGANSFVAFRLKVDTDDWQISDIRINAIRAACERLYKRRGDVTEQQFRDECIAAMPGKWRLGS